MISQQTPTKYQVCNRNMPSLQKQVLIKLDNASLQSNQFAKNCFFCNAKYIFLCSPSYALLIVNKQCCSLTINCKLTSLPRLHRPLVLELRVFGRQPLREDGGTTRGNTEEEIFWDIWLQTERGFWRICLSLQINEKIFTIFVSAPAWSKAWWGWDTPPPRPLTTWEQCFITFFMLVI